MVCPVFSTYATRAGWVVAVMLVALGCAAKATPPPEDDEPEKNATCLRLGGEEGPGFLSMLPGSWSGTALRTPLGEIPYDLDFRSLDANAIEGQSSTNGQAVHTWQFRLSAENEMYLDFHSTFGDSHAKGLCVVRVDPSRGWLFSGGNPSFLQVWVDASERDWKAEILLRDRPHVSIAAQR